MHIFSVHLTISRVRFVAGSCYHRRFFLAELSLIISKSITRLTLRFAAAFCAVCRIRLLADHYKPMHSSPINRRKIRTATGTTTTQSLTLKSCGKVTLPKSPFFKMLVFSMGYSSAKIPVPINPTTLLN